MNAVEEKYWSHVHSMTGQQRLARSVSLLDDIRKMIAHKITRSQPNLTGRELNRRIAIQLYRNDPITQAMLERAADGPDRVDCNSQASHRGA